MLGYFGAACVLGIAAIGSAIGIGIAGQAAIGAWKRCYMNNKPAPFILTVFAGAPLTQTIYGFLLMQTMIGKVAEGAMKDGAALALGIFSGLAMAVSAISQGKAGEPVTQATLKVVGSFHGLSRERSDARKYPAIDPLDSWSKYKSVIREDWVAFARRALARGTEVNQMMKVVGEEGTSTEDYIAYLKSDFLDAVYFQQNSFDAVDSACVVERQAYIFKKIVEILGTNFALTNKDDARDYFNKLRQTFLDWNYTEWQSSEFKKIEDDLNKLYASCEGKLTAE